MNTTIFIKINTPLQRGDLTDAADQNRFNGFPRAAETVETVSFSCVAFYTSLKRGVNEKPPATL